MNTLYIISKWLTFPGAMLRATVEHIFLKICGIPVEDNRILRNDELFGHVEHELAPSARTSFTICFAPAFVLSFIGLLLFAPSVFALFFAQMTGWLNIAANAVAYYLSICIFCNCYPLIEDALNMKDKIYGGESVWLKIIYAPGFACLYALSFLEKYCLTFLMSILITIGLVFQM